ncbi:winged helix-turn-helix transcriptional regulator [Bacillus sp. NTK074B]|uniref:MarR family winged helix-turn-helix transcriptional regulator n=1 Tax=Bacillus sp. NTK074B TaxID=2802174 RepID=UPI001A90CB40|nr:winged helix-turn-helix transcriptional regulator [Bacillus sp. NTK074B]
MNDKAKLLNQYWTDIYFHLHYPHQDKISHQVVRILQLVDKKSDVGVNEISLSLQISHNTASEHVKRMIGKGYLRKGRDPLDERRVILSLTEQGEKVLHRNTSLDEKKLAKILEQLNGEEEKLVKEALQLLSQRAKECM